uniref:Uncharacterized protein n=1 Tax=Methylocapsa acidiphila TaxID=133552 RepID=Q2VNH1_METAI|nr:hypothetical protein orf130 [Methylocapsa acidiphila]
MAGMRFGSGRHSCCGRSSGFRHPWLTGCCETGDGNSLAASWLVPKRARDDGVCVTAPRPQVRFLTCSAALAATPRRQTAEHRAGLSTPFEKAPIGQS